MQKKLLILSVFLLTHFILMSQNGSTVYPLSGEQVRTLARVKLEFTFLLDENKSMHEMLVWCDSITIVNDRIIKQKDIQLLSKDQVIKDLDKIIIFKDDKFKLSEEQQNKLKNQKNLFIGTTLLTTLLLIIVVL